MHDHYPRITNYSIFTLLILHVPANLVMNLAIRLCNMMINDNRYKHNHKLTMRLDDKK